MNRYIDAEKLKRFVGELKKQAKRNCCDSWEIVPDALEGVEGFIDSLQQEQPNVDLEEEVRKYCGSSFRFNYDELNDSFYSNTFEFDDVVELARHFYVLGRNTKKQ